MKKINYGLLSGLCAALKSDTGELGRLRTAMIKQVAAMLPKVESQHFVQADYAKDLQRQVLQLVQQAHEVSLLKQTLALMRAQDVAIPDFSPSSFHLEKYPQKQRSKAIKLWHQHLAPHNKTGFLMQAAIKATELDDMAAMRCAFSLFSNSPASLTETVYSWESTFTKIRNLPVDTLPYFVKILSKVVKDQRTADSLIASPVNANTVLGAYLVARLAPEYIGRLSKDVQAQSKRRGIHPTLLALTEMTESAHGLLVLASKDLDLVDLLNAHKGSVVSQLTRILDFPNPRLAKKLAKQKRQQERGRKVVQRSPHPQIDHTKN